MLINPLGNFISLREEHPQNALASIFFIVVGRFTVSRYTALSNIYRGILVNLPVISIFLSFSHPEKIPLPVLSKTLLFISKLSIFEQSSKAPDSITETFDVIVTLLRLVQPEKAPPPIDVTPSGKSILLSDLHPQNALAPILLIVCGRLTVSKYSAPSNI